MVRHAKITAMPSPAAASVHTLIEAWKLMVGRLPSGTFEHTNGLATILGHVALPFLNLSAHDRPLPDAAAVRQLLTEAQEKSAVCAFPSMYALCLDLAPKDWQAAAAELGLVPTMQLTGMEANEILPPRRPAPALELRRVSDEATARDLAKINAHAYTMPEDAFECICNLHLWHEDSYGYVGYVDGQPVTAAAALPVDNSVYIALVATEPGQHGKGYADTVMRHAIAEGQKSMGVTRTTLHASDMGAPVYRAMGYHPTAQFTILMSAH